MLQEAQKRNDGKLKDIFKKKNVHGTSTNMPKLFSETLRKM